MAFNRGIFLAALVVVVAAAELVGNAAAATYVVGDSLGWRVPTGGAADYATWASQHVFRVGDVLVFNFSTGVHTAAKVTRGAHDACTSTNPISLATVGPASFTLNSTGPDFYICTFGQHCALGQKLAINVTSPSATPAPAPAPAPITPPSPSSAPTPSTTPSPSPSSSTSTSPSPSPSPALTPSPSPSGTITPSPTSEMSPELAPSPSSSTMGDLSPPPPPSSATITTIRAAFAVFAPVIVGLMI